MGLAPGTAEQLEADPISGWKLCACTVTYLKVCDERVRALAQVAMVCDHAACLHQQQIIEGLHGNRRFGIMPALAEVQVYPLA